MPENETEAAAKLHGSSWQIFGVATALFAAVGCATLIAAWMNRQPATLREARSTPSPSRLPVVGAIALLLAIASALMVLSTAPAGGFVVGYAFPMFLVGAAAGLVSAKPA